MWCRVWGYWRYGMWFSWENWRGHWGFLCWFLSVTQSSASSTVPHGAIYWTIYWTVTLDWRKWRWSLCFIKHEPCHCSLEATCRTILISNSSRVLWAPDKVSDAGALLGWWPGTSEFQLFCCMEFSSHSFSTSTPPCRFQVLLCFHIYHPFLLTWN